jgi:hypothetical protein
MKRSTITFTLIILSLMHVLAYEQQSINVTVNGKSRNMVVFVPNTLPAMSLNTFILKIDKGSTAIENVKQDEDDDDASPKTYYDLQGRKLESPQGLCIERSANGNSRKVMFRN